MHNTKDISIDSAIFAGLTIVRDRPTDRPRYSICNNGTAMRPKRLSVVTLENYLAFIEVREIVLVILLVEKHV